MARKKIPDDKKKVKTGVTVDKNLIEIMDEFLEESGTSNRSKYVEKLIREDLIKRGKNIERDF